MINKCVICDEILSKKKVMMFLGKKYCLSCLERIKDGVFKYGNKR